MRIRKCSFLFSILLVSLVVLSQTPVPSHSQAHDQPRLSAETRELIAKIRGTTAEYRDVAKAQQAGYNLFLDCFRNDQIGGMGQHYVNGDLAGDDQLDPLRPEALVYEPRADGQLILVAMEYLVFKDKWDPNNTNRKPPSLFGVEFHLKTDIPQTPPVWVLHMWLWTHNPEGLFADYNPLVYCPDMLKAK
ncbi:MAG: hypothetical protein IT324_20935 [Anaerolineae bacterium]|nr:hypothetical protein [Anaerolineae bacterium]